MGTNYYLHEKAPCATCWHGEEPRHIGKSSVGWCFSLHVYPEENINDLDDWLPLLRLAGSVIKNEYGDVIEPGEMIAEIKDRVGRNDWMKLPHGYMSWTNFHFSNLSEEGPNNLLRHRVSDNHCIKQGAGTWDCIIGEFS